jgi:hypothetical protein
MNIRSIKMAVITAGLATAPMLSVAANSPVAMDSCVKAFMAQLSTTMAKQPKLRSSRYIDDRSSGDSKSELTLTARDANDHHPIARVLCTVDTAGQVIDLRREPLADYGLVD